MLAQTSGGQWYNESVSVTDTHTFSPNLVNQALFSFNHTDGAFVPIQPTKSLVDLGAKYSNDPIYKWQIACRATSASIRRTPTISRGASVSS